MRGDLVIKMTLTTYVTNKQKHLLDKTNDREHIYMRKLVWKN